MRQLLFFLLFLGVVCCQQAAFADTGPPKDFTELQQVAPQFEIQAMPIVLQENVYTHYSVSGTASPSTHTAVLDDTPIHYYRVGNPPFSCRSYDYSQLKYGVYYEEPDYLIAYGLRN